MTEDTSRSTKPTKTFRSGSVHAAVWESTELSESGESVIRHSIRITRRYKGKTSDEWKSSDYYNYPSHLADLALVAQEAYKHIRLHENGGEVEIDEGAERQPPSRTSERKSSGQPTLCA